MKTNNGNETRLAFSVALCILGGSMCLAGDEPKKYTLQDCLRIGAERSSSIATARRNEEIADAEVTKSQAPARPNLTITGGYKRNDELQPLIIEGLPPTDVGSLDSYYVTCGASQLLYSGGKVDAMVESATMNRKLAGWNSMAAREELARDIKLGFYGILLARASLKVREESLDQVKNYLDHTQTRFDSDKASEFELLTAKVRHANEKPNVLSAENACNLALAKYRVLLNLDNSPFELVGKLEYRPFDFDLEQLYSMALAKRSAIKQAEAKVSVAAREIEVAKAAYRPSLHAFVNYTGGNSASPVPLPDTEAELHWDAGLSFSWSLWDGGTRGADVKQKELQMENDQTGVSDLKKAVFLELKQAYMDMEVAKKVMKSSMDNVQLAEKGLSIAKTRYESGASTYLELLDANLACNQAKLAFNQSLHDYMAAVARIEFACGMELLKFNQPKK